MVKDADKLQGSADQLYVIASKRGSQTKVKNTHKIQGRSIEAVDKG